jgi:hypothetical protein
MACPSFVDTFVTVQAHRCRLRIDSWPKIHRGNLPDPHILAEEIADDLRSALEQIESVLGDLQARAKRGTVKTGLAGEERPRSLAWRTPCRWTWAWRP